MYGKSQCNLCLSVGLMEDLRTLDQLMEANIIKYLWAELVANARDSIFTICNNCCATLTTFHRFYCSIEQRHSQSRIAAGKGSATEEPLSIVEEHGSSLAPHSVFINCYELVSDEPVQNERPDAVDEEHDEVAQKSTIDTVNRQRNREAQDAAIVRFYRRIVCETCDVDCMTRGEPAIEFESWEALVAHVRSDHSELQLRMRTFLSCPVCEKKLRTRAQLLRHREFHLHPERFRCAVCAELHEHMREHVQNKHRERRFECEVCGKKFPFKERLTAHRKRMHLEKDVVCDQCQKPFSRFMIEDHKRSVHVARFACEQCPKTFKMRFRFQQHQEEHQNADGINRSSAVPCPVCGQVMRDKYNLQRHLKLSHTDQPPVSCDSCGKSFKNKRSLAIHTANVCAAAPARTFDCAVCGRSFRRRVKLKEHMATHTGKQVYVCTFCPETFRQDTHLYSHRKRAHPEQWLEMQRQRKAGRKFKVTELA